ncbi:growth hormone secretagogue receptor type 1 [Octopus bimaculoides]|uniref:G-protein coupled receptors family 1 profile domain-containing protein n=1 Tax=Octopus bimaculoides TaxID=37653 RepID=A0A0L8HT07_OCTBM|nr:growth hormone secretagogue receptor type 1 [Octopus bimaculoides]XP_014769675.1 growth hormone secretagogue receptor type 1 [Octopus bimaculoides]|eukprot:XP_014769673.1 PREDICTED: probable G-protein coupled receptor 139 [Octopus bimaculoides]
MMMMMENNQTPTFESVFGCQTIDYTFENISIDNMSASQFGAENCLLDTVQMDVGDKIYAFSTPVIFAMGILGNSISLKIFLSKNFRRQAGGVYLASLSCADIFALVFYVMTEWLKKIPLFLMYRRKIPVLDTEGMCQMIQFLSYTFRFLSSWLVVIFTVERYIGVCHPFKRLEWCTTKTARRSIGFLVFLSLAINSYKPALTKVYRLHGDLTKCTGNLDYRYLSFVLDSVYAVSITFVPFVFIFLLNVLIIRALVRLKRRQKTNQVKAKEAVGRTDFTLLLLMISFCFIAFKLPFFVTWCQQFFFTIKLERSDLDEINDHNRLLVMKEALNISRIIFYMSYVTNFFLYSFVGSSFRLELKRLLSCRHKKGRTNNWTPQRTYLRSEISHVESFHRNTTGKHQSIDEV